MAKLKLDVDDLHVESFGTHEPHPGRAGTVHARSGPPDSNTCVITVLATCTCPPNSSVGQDCFCTEAPSCFQCDEDH